MQLKEKKILLGVTGSIAAYKAGDIIRRLQDRGAVVTVIMTAEAQQFVTKLTLAALSGRKVYSEMFDDAEAWSMPHIDLAKNHDLLLIAPATANIIAKIAHGFADDLLTCTVITARVPVVIVPAMNTEMFTHPAVQENCNKLRSAGHQVLDPVEGKLACGVTGQGHLPEVENIVQAVVRSVR